MNDIKEIHITAYFQYDYVTRLYFKANFSFGLQVQKDQGYVSCRNFTFA